MQNRKKAEGQEEEEGKRRRRKKVRKRWRRRTKFLRKFSSNPLAHLPLFVMTISVPFE